MGNRAGVRLFGRIESGIKRHKLFASKLFDSKKGNGYGIIIRLLATQVLDDS